MASIEIIAQARTSIAAAQLTRFDFRAPMEQSVRNADAYNLNLALAPRPTGARAAYSRHWQHDRFEPIGALCVLPPQETVLFRSDPGATTCIICDVDSRAAAQWFDEEMDWAPMGLERTLNLPDARLRGLLINLAKELRYPGFASDAMIDLQGAQIALELSRSWRASRTIPQEGGLSPGRLDLINQRLGARGSTPSLAELAALCGLSVRQLSRSFKASRGVSIGHHIAARRLEMAKHLLRSDRSLKAIAHDLGFNSPSSFGHAFRKSAGMTPNAYRAELRGL